MGEVTEAIKGAQAIKDSAEKAGPLNTALFVALIEGIAIVIFGLFLLIGPEYQTEAAAAKQERDRDIEIVSLRSELKDQKVINERAIAIHSRDKERYDTLMEKSKELKALVQKVDDELRRR